MGKWFVWFWIVALISTLVGMQALLFGTKGLPFSKRGGTHPSTRAPGEAQPPTKPGEKPVIEHEVGARPDQSPAQAAGSGGQMERYRPIKVSAGTIQRIEVVGGAIPSMARDAIVWLPPGYSSLEARQTKYPVLYLMDGQNVFEKAPASGASWNAAETAGKLIADGKIQPLIIVAIPHAGAARASEYLPFEMLDNVQPRGAEFISFLTGEVMPRIERMFRIQSGPDTTAIGGASLGAIIALEAAARRPDVFGKVLAESMPLIHKDRAAFKHFSATKTWPRKIAFGMGGKETGSDPKNAGANSQYTGTATAFAELAKGKGLGPDRFRLTIDEAAEHNEAAWARRFGPALEFLFPAAK